MNHKISIVTLFILLICLLLGKTAATDLSDLSDCAPNGTPCSPWEGTHCCGTCAHGSSGWGCAGLDSFSF